MTLLRLERGGGLAINLVEKRGIGEGEKRCKRKKLQKKFNR